MHSTINTAFLAVLFVMSLYFQSLNDGRVHQLNQELTILSGRVERLELDQREDVKHFTKEAFQDLIKTPEDTLEDKPKEFQK